MFWSDSWSFEPCEGLSDPCAAAISPTRPHGAELHIVKREVWKNCHVAAEVVHYVLAHQLQPRWAVINNSSRKVCLYFYSHFFQQSSLKKNWKPLCEYQSCLPHANIRNCTQTLTETFWKFNLALLLFRGFVLKRFRPLCESSGSWKRAQRSITMVLIALL